LLRKQLKTLESYFFAALCSAGLTKMKMEVWPKWRKLINSRWRRPPFWVSSIVHNLFTIAHIFTKFCTYFYKIWQVYYVWGPTCMYAKILNKNKIQDGGGRHFGFLHKQ